MLTTNDADKAARTAFEQNFNKNVFVMMRYGNDAKFRIIEQTIKETLRRAGLTAVLAKDVQFHKSLWDNIQYCMDNCRYGIVVYEQILSRDYNPNVTLELGYMFGRDRTCLILKEKGLQYLHTDVLSFLYQEFESDTASLESSVRTALNTWLSRVLVFKPAETISSDSDGEAALERTRRIVESLEGVKLQVGNDASGVVIRHASLMSSLAIAEQAYRGSSHPDYSELLLQERNLLLLLLKRGATVKCIIAPHIHRERVRRHLTSVSDVQNNILPKFATLCRTVKAHLDNENLLIVPTIRLTHDNVLIVGDAQIFIGRTRIHEIGISKTTVIYDPAVIRDETDEFERSFCDDARAILPKLSTPITKPEIRRLKSAVLGMLKQEAADLQKHTVSV